MNTKEAIKFCESSKERITSYDIEDGQKETIENYNENFDNIVEFLQCGEKYKKMWGEFKSYFPYLRDKLEVKEFIEKFEQKYFPNNEVIK